jgi:hypothetical protein
MLNKFHFSRHIFVKITQYEISRKSIYWKKSCSMRSDRRTLIFAFRNCFANGLENVECLQWLSHSSGWLCPPSVAMGAFRRQKYWTDFDKIQYRISHIKQILFRMPFLKHLVFAISRINREKGALDASCLSERPADCPHGSARLPLQVFPWNFTLGTCKIKSVEKPQIWLKWDKNNPSMFISLVAVRNIL